jgi:hypothetical protein
MLPAEGVTDNVNTRRLEKNGRRTGMMRKRRRNVREKEV